MHELCQTHYQILLNILAEDINKNKCKECKGKCLDCMEERFSKVNTKIVNVALST